MIKGNPTDSTLCPLCNAKLELTYVGEYCEKCPFFDGYANLNNRDAEKHKDKILNKIIK